jgi:hypothetical protein
MQKRQNAMSEKYVLIEKYAFRLGVLLGFWKEHNFKTFKNNHYDILKDHFSRFYDDAVAAEYDSQTQ